MVQLKSLALGSGIKRLCNLWRSQREIRARNRNKHPPTIQCFLQM